ncbi:MAG: TonB-dependent receptor [Prevotella sp.]
MNKTSLLTELNLMQKKALFVYLTFFLLLTAFPLNGEAKQFTVRQQMERASRSRNIHFVYDASLPLDIPCRGHVNLKSSLPDLLTQIFTDTDITFEIKGRYVMLMRKKGSVKHVSPSTLAKHTPKERRHTLSGYVTDSSGETLVNVTILDQTTGAATMTNAHGFFSLTLPEGEHLLTCSYLGFDTAERTIHLTADQTLKIQMQEDNQLSEVVVKGDLNSPLMSTQTGKHSFSRHDIQTEFSLLSSSDVVKTLQRVSGVSEGVELASGLYVHGGNADENLFLIDGTPLYQVNHAMGLFSAFNADVVKNVDFYKGGFPARYGGRLSSVIDVRTSDGDFQHLHGSYRIGLIDGGLHLEGPIVKGKTSFNFGLRRSWLDLIARPAFSIYNHSNNAYDDDITLYYFFHDINLKLTHILSPRTRASLSVYSGKDKLSTSDKCKDRSESSFWYDYDSKYKYRWGNLNVAAQLEHQFSPKLFANFAAVYTYNFAKFDSYEIDIDYDADNKPGSQSHIAHGYHSTINDLGYRTAFDFRPSPRHHIRFGHDLIWHIFRPQTQSRLNVVGDSEGIDTVRSSSNSHYGAIEANVYVEDAMTINEHWSLNGGFNASLFHIGRKNFTDFCPRFSLKYQPLPILSFKASITAMSQFVHKISNSFVDLPTDYWVPTTERLHPMHSWQTTVGAYFQPDRHWLVSIEGYYKKSTHLLQYANWNGLEPPAEKWDQLVMNGRGRFYGMEIDATFRTHDLILKGSYTLSWNERKYREFYDGWYPDKFDNRHKLNLSARWNISRKVNMFAEWCLHSGNRITVPTQWALMPNVPDGSGSHEDNTFIYERPNNYTLPLYHRLDVGFDFHHTTKHGHERIWNLSFYNVYCHLNSWFVEVKEHADGSFYLKNHAFIPIIPSFSYTIKF